VEKTRWTYNSALMIRANLELYRATGEKPLLEEARRIARASEHEFTNPETSAFRDDAVFSHLLVEAFLDLHRETGEEYLMKSARANADFLERHARDDKDGGYWREWTIRPDRKEPRKLLIANAASARLLWLVSQQLK